MTLLVLGVLGFVLVLVFRTELKAMMLRISGFRAERGDLALAAEFQEGEKRAALEATPDEPAPEGRHGDHLEPDEKSVRDPDEAGRENGHGSEQLIPAMIDAVFERNDAKATELYERIREDAKDQKARKIEEARWYAVRFMAGTEPDAIVKVDRLAEDGDVAARVRYFAGVALAHVGQPLEAAEFFAKSAASASEPADRAEAVAARARALVDAGRRDTALEVVQAALGEEADVRAQAHLWEALAHAYGEDEPELRGLALQRAAETSGGNNPLLRFRAAYAFSRVGEPPFNALSIHHYLKVLAIDSKDETALNNLGVQLERAELSLLCIDRYKQAAELGNTLASANLAYRYMKAGFGDEAKTTLEKAQASDDPHPNVAEASASLASRREEQEEQLSVLHERGQQSAIFLSRYATAMVEQAVTGLTGNWAWTEDQTPVEVAESSGELEAIWQDGGTKKRFVATIQGRAAKVKFSKMGYSGFGSSRTETGWESDGTGYLVIIDDGAIDTLRISGDQQLFGRLIRAHPD